MGNPDPNDFNGLAAFPLWIVPNRRLIPSVLDGDRVVTIGPDIYNDAGSGPIAARRISEPSIERLNDRMRRTPIPCSACSRYAANLRLDKLGLC